MLIWRLILDVLKPVVGPPLTTSHVECSANDRAAAGIPEGLVRYSVGIEDVEDLIADLRSGIKFYFLVIILLKNCN